MLRTIEERLSTMSRVLDLLGRNTEHIRASVERIDLEAQLRRTQEVAHPPNQAAPMQFQFHPPRYDEDWYQTWNTKAFLDVTTRSQKYKRWLSSIPGPTREIVSAIQRENHNSFRAGEPRCPTRDLFFAIILKQYQAE